MGRGNLDHMMPRWRDRGRRARLDDSRLLGWMRLTVSQTRSAFSSVDEIGMKISGTSKPQRQPGASFHVMRLVTATHFCFNYTDSIPRKARAEDPNLFNVVEVVHPRVHFRMAIPEPRKPPALCLLFYAFIMLRGG